MRKANRGLRNNNPLNIRKGQHWIGESLNQTDEDFVIFLDMVYGVRAAFVILHTYMESYHINTVRMIIQRWAPPVENDTNRYIAFVCERLNVSPDTVLDWYDRESMMALFNAMSKMETGVELNQVLVIKGYALAQRKYM